MPDRPSLLVLMTDQQAVSSLGCYGNQRVETPNVDSLAGDGVQFERAYCAQPVCTPNRSAMVTGLYPHTTGLTENNTPLPRHLDCLPELADFEGYTTAWMGKWDLGNEIYPQHGFDVWRSIEDGYQDQYTHPTSDRTHSTYHDFLVENGFEPDQDDGTFSRGFAADLPEEYTKAAYLGNEATEFIEAHREDPFILFVSFLEPHSPFFGPRDDQYDREDVLPENFAHDGLDDQPLRARLFREYRRRPDAEWRDLVARYWGLASLVDTHAGRILDCLDEQGRSEDTVTVYTSDHGTMMGSHQLVGKNVMFEESIRIPWLLDLPGEDLPESVEQPVSQIDLVPTLLDALGRERPDHLHGHSLLPFLRGERSEPVEPTVVVEQNGPDGEGVNRRKDSWPGEGSLPGLAEEVLSAAEEWGHSEDAVRRAYQEPIRTALTADGWKLNYRRDGDHELYDLEADPYETENLAADRPETVERLRDEILDWQVRTRDPVHLH
jgi:arylsulfatase A-like enzyme